MNKRGNVTAAVLGSLFIVFSLFFLYVYNSGITGYVTGNFVDTDSNKFYVNQAINGSVVLVIASGEKLLNDTSFQLGIYNSNNVQYGLKLLSADEILNKTFNLEKKQDASGYYYDQNGNYKFQLLNYSLSHNGVGNYELRFMRRVGVVVQLELLANKLISFAATPTPPALQNGLINITFIGGKPEGNKIVSFTGDFNKGDYLGCQVNFKSDVIDPVDISIYTPGTTNLNNPFKKFTDVNRSVNANVTCGALAQNVISCFVVIQVYTIIPGEWRCLAKQGQNNLLSDSMTMAGSSILFTQNIPDITLTKEGTYVGKAVNVKDYISNPSNSVLQYFAIGAQYITATVQSDGNLIFANSQGFEGNESIIIRVYDGNAAILSNKINIVVGTHQNIPVNITQECYPSWDCNIWGQCVEGVSVRTCNDSNSCNSEVGKPELTQTCQDTGTTARTQVNIQGTKQNVKLDTSFVSGITRIILIVLLILAVLGTGGFALYWFKFRKPGEVIKQETKTNDQQNQAVQNTDKKTQETSSNLGDMRRYAETMITQGQQEQKVKADLIAAGWNKVDVDNVVNYLVLKKFINFKIKAGFNKDKIKESLLAKGWKKELVEKIFAELN